MNPYEAQQSKIPHDDPYWDLPLYGRYHPTPEDFKPLDEHCDSYTSKSLDYWEKVLHRCDSSKYVYQNPFGGRDVFALGSVIIKSGHLSTENGNISNTESKRNYAIADANEVAAIRLASDTVMTPQILFAGKIKDHHVLIQSRIAGVALNVAWPYLSGVQKASFKNQTRDIIRKLNKIHAPSMVLEPTYIVPDADPVVNRDIESREGEILFCKYGTDQPLGSCTTGLSLMHNDLQPSNIIVKDDMIVGIVDWEHAGWFRWRDVRLVHSYFRTPRKENYASAGMSEQELDDLVYWSDLYEFDL